MVPELEFVFLADMLQSEKFIYAIKLYNELHALTRQIFRGGIIIKDDPISKLFEKNHQHFNRCLQNISPELNQQMFFNLNWPDKILSETITNEKIKNLTMRIAYPK